MGILRCVRFTTLDGEKYSSRRVTTFEPIFGEVSGGVGDDEENLVSMDQTVRYDIDGTVHVRRIRRWASFQSVYRLLGLGSNRFDCCLECDDVSDLYMKSLGRTNELTVGKFNGTKDAPNENQNATTVQGPQEIFGIVG